MNEHDFEVLYRKDPGYIRANANLPGTLVLPVAQLEAIADHMDNTRHALEARYGADKDNLDAFWMPWGVTANANPVGQIIQPYQQLSRAESMKGSEQVVRGFQGYKPPLVEGVNESPNLTPRQSGPAGTTVVIQQVTREAKKGPPKWGGLAGGR